MIDQTGRLLHTLRLDSAAIEYLEMSLLMENQQNRNYEAAFTHDLIARSLIRMKKIKEARKHMDEAVRISSTLKEADRLTIQAEFADMLYDEGKIDSALNVIRPLPSSVDSITLPFCLAMSATIYNEAGIQDTAYMYARKLTKLKTPYNKKIGYKVIFSDGLRDYVPKDTLLKLMPEYKQTVEDYLDTHEAEQALFQNARYNYSVHVKQRQETEKKLRSLKETIWMIGGSLLILLLAAVSVMLWRKYRKTKNDSEVMEAMVFVEKLREETDHAETPAADGHSDMDTLEAPEDTKGLRQRIVDHIQALKDSYPRSLIDSRLLDSHICKELKDRIDSNECIGKSDDILKRLAELIEAVTPGFGRRLDILTEWSLSDKERNVALLMRCGFSNSQIAALLAKSKSTISSQRSAIAKKAGLTVNGINAAIASL